MLQLKRIFCLFFFIVLLATTEETNAQISFSHALGGSFYAGGHASAPAITYSPRLNFIQVGEEFTISAGTHIGLGMDFNSQEGARSFALDLPLVAEVNIGHGATRETSSGFGAFFGAGYGISKLGSASAFGSDYNDAAGFVVNGGLRALIAERPVGLRVSYLLNTKADAGNVFGIGIFYTFGDF